jgi:hypothetical protein
MAMVFGVNKALWNPKIRSAANRSVEAARTSVSVNGATLCDRARGEVSPSAPLDPQALGPAA